MATYILVHITLTPLNEYESDHQSENISYFIRFLLHVFYYNCGQLSGLVTITNMVLTLITRGLFT